MPLGRVAAPGQRRLLDARGGELGPELAELILPARRAGRSYAARRRRRARRRADSSSLELPRDRGLGKLARPPDQLDRHALAVAEDARGRRRPAGPRCRAGRARARPACSKQVASSSGSAVTTSSSMSETSSAAPRETLPVARPPRPPAGRIRDPLRKLQELEAAGRRQVALALDQLDAVAVRVADEAEPRAALAYLVRLALGLDALGGQALERAVEVLDRQRDVPVAGAELVGVDAEVVGQLELGRVLTGDAEEVVRRLVADRQLAAASPGRAPRRTRPTARGR